MPAVSSPAEFRIITVARLCYALSGVLIALLCGTTLADLFGRSGGSLVYTGLCVALSLASCWPVLVCLARASAPPLRLRLSEAGFFYRPLFRLKLVRWEDVSNIVPNEAEDGAKFGLRVELKSHARRASVGISTRGLNASALQLEHAFLNYWRRAGMRGAIQGN